MKKSPPRYRYLLAVILPIAGFTLPAHAGVLWKHDFENARMYNVKGKFYDRALEDNNREYALSKQGNGSYPSIVSFKVGGRGGHKIRHRCNSSSNKTSRSETFLVMPKGWPDGSQRRKVEFKVYIPDYVGNYDKWCILFQAWQGPSNPPFSIQVNRNSAKGDTLDLKMNMKWGQGPDKDGAYDGSSGQTNINIGTYDKGRWYTFRVILDFDPLGPDAFARVQVREGGSWRTKGTHRGRMGHEWPNKGFNDPEIKYGIYGKFSGAKEHYFDEVKFIK